ncbi:MAG TPA: PIN domain-containing protein, partial [Anaerolineales bacterium]|nr:PIN domain-containing protein [Anaerolineales bacterium]
MSCFIGPDLFPRYLADDVPGEADEIETLLKRAAAGETALATNSLAIAEVVWALEAVYGVSRERIRETVLAILNTPGLAVAEAEVVLQAALWYGERNVDFIDAFNAAWLLDRELPGIYTFDRRQFSR